MQRAFIIDRDLFAAADLTQGEEQYMTIDGFHVSVRFTRVIDVMGAIPAAAAVQAPASVDVADAQLHSVCAALSFLIGNALSGVLCNLAPAREMNSRETAFAVNS